MLDLGVLMYEGVQLQNTRFFPWRRGTAFSAGDNVNRGEGTAKKSDPNGGAMPLVLVSASDTTLVASPLSDFFTACQTDSFQTSNFSFGLQGTVTAVEKNHFHATVVVAGSGVRSTMMHWGDIMLKSAGGGKNRSMDWTRSGDAGLKSLSYYTDNGAYYYYQTAPDSCNSSNTACCAYGCKTKPIPPATKDASGYQSTLKSLVADFAKNNVPIHTIQYDSWWYYKGTEGGIKLWEPMPSTLGGDDINGDPDTWLSLPNISTITHSRYFDDDNEYVMGTAPGLNGATFGWVGGCDGIAVSNDTAFFRHLYSRAKQGLGMVTYEQDFLAHQYEMCPTTYEAPGVAKSWLTAMANAAEDENITLQYCMALPRHILQSASFPRVSHARASHDYGQSRSDDTEQWSSTGLTSMLYWSLGLLPFKDDFWSETNEAGSHFNSTEADPELQTLVSALLAGPVGPADAIGLLNRTRLMQTCTADGTLLKPLAPAMNTDRSLSQRVSDLDNNDNNNNNLGVDHVWITELGVAATSAQTKTEKTTRKAVVASETATTPSYFVALLANITSKSGATLNIDDLSRAGDTPAMSSSGYLAREYYSHRLMLINQTTPLQVATMVKPTRCGQQHYTSDYCTPFELWTFSPVLPFVFLGEISKYIAVSPQRFSDLVIVTDSLSVSVHGSSGEVVTIGVADASSLIHNGIGGVDGVDGVYGGAGVDGVAGVAGVDGVDGVDWGGKMVSVECNISASGVAVLICTPSVQMVCKCS